MAKRAVCVGINDYPGTFNDLNGCVNDANDWANVLKDFYGFGNNIQVILDSDATKDAIMNALGDLVTGAHAGDIVVFTYSGHGTWQYDNGDRDESDNRDEALCPADDTVLLDDDLRSIIRQINPEARLTVISDSCHSGSITRMML
ncbi:MAG: caspase family protein, partial [Chlorobiales bacterium]|nr:caspase family protein [Chlorobiales bacterium]